MEIERPVVFLTFADGDIRYSRAATRLTAEAKATGIYSDLHNLNLDWLRGADPEVMKIVRNCLSRGDIKGIGYWAWKSSLLIWAANKYPNHVIHYMDAGHVILPGIQAHNQIRDWIKEGSQRRGLAWQLPSHPEIEWTKKETLLRLDPEGKFWQTSQIEGGFLILNSEIAREFGSTLRDIELERDGYYLFDSKEVPELGDFKAHRHDQSIHSLLWKKAGLHYRTTETSYPGGCKSVIAARHASGFRWRSKAIRSPIEAAEFYFGKAQKFIHMHPNKFTKPMNYPLKRCQG